MIGVAVGALLYQFWTHESALSFRLGLDWHEYEHSGAVALRSCGR